MNCRASHRFILVERDGGLSDAQRTELAAHLDSCASCRQLRTGLETALTRWRSEESARPVPDPDIEWHKLWRRLNPPPPASRRHRSPWLLLPAAVAAATALGLYYVMPGPGPVHLNSAAPRAIARQEAPSATSTPQTSTVVYVDESSGWTFVWAPDNGGQHI